MNDTRTSFIKIEDKPTVYFDVDLIISKPQWFYDDLPASIWLTEGDRIYKEGK